MIKGKGLYTDLERIIPKILCEQVHKPLNSVLFKNKSVHFSRPSSRPRSGRYEWAPTLGHWAPCFWMLTWGKNLKCQRTQANKQHIQVATPHCHQSLSEGVELSQEYSEIYVKW